MHPRPANSAGQRKCQAVSLLQKSSSSPVTCHATGFYPDEAELMWRKDGVELHEEVDKGEILPNHDGSFQMKLSSVPPEDWEKYDRVFQLSGVKTDIITKLKENQIRTSGACLAFVIIQQRSPQAPTPKEGDSKAQGAPWGTSPPSPREPMRPGGALLLCNTVSAVTHSLKYFYTQYSQGQSFPEFVLAGFIDEVQIISYNKFIMTAVLKQDWVKKVAKNDPQFWEREVQNFKFIQQKFKGDIEQLHNQTDGVHTFQMMYGCDREDEIDDIRGFFQSKYDGTDFYLLDLKTESWTAPKSLALSTKLKLDHDNEFNKHLKRYLTVDCVDLLKKFVNYGQDALLKPVLPSVSFLQKNSSSPITCFATGFYPDKAELMWIKDGVDLYDDVDKGEILPNHDGTFQMSADLNVLVLPKDRWRYDCVFQLTGVNEDKIKITKLEKTVIKKNEVDLLTVLIPVIVATAVLAVILLTGFITHKCKTDPSIHLLPLFRRSGSWRQQFKQRSPDFPLPSHLLHLFRGDTKAFPDQLGDIVSPPSPGSAPGSPPSGTCLKHLKWEASRRHPNQMPIPPQLTPFNVEEQRFYSEPLPDD
ncbi:uncharacterized protein KZ484_007460 [Pholidichthys leucotaenia]